VTGGVWWRYLNTGCSIFPDVITCVEWSRHNVEHPEAYPRLVAWTWNEPLRCLQRRVMFERTRERLPLKRSLSSFTSPSP
jgi:hypothetical protein